MLKSAANDYSKLLDIDLDEKLQPMNCAIDEMLIRLEEFEAMMALVQQERCNAIGMTGSLMECVDFNKDVKNLCERIDAVEKLVEYVKLNMTVLESKMDLAEVEFGVSDNTKMIKNFFMPLFKKSTEIRSPPAVSNMEPFAIKDFFINSEQEPQS